MSVFDNVTEMNGQIVAKNWIEWDHFFIPNNPEPLRSILKVLMMLLGHCGNCLALDGCYFIDSKRPENPLHHYFHCNLLNVSEYQVKGIGSA